MKPLVKVAVSQRVDAWPDRGERRDALDQRLCQWLAAAGGLAIPVPNSLAACGVLNPWLHDLHPDAILLSGGNDIGNELDRDSTERILLEYAQERDLPMLGICRGMQMMGVWAGASLVKVEGHVRIRHELPSWPGTVNSFHNLALAGPPAGFAVTARAADGAIEAIRHERFRWEGWMWHPEREEVFDSTHIARFCSLLAERSHR